jgi:hypothetical protein
LGRLGLEQLVRGLDLGVGGLADERGMGLGDLLDDLGHVVDRARHGLGHAGEDSAKGCGKREKVSPTAARIWLGLHKLGGLAADLLPKLRVGLRHALVGVEVKPSQAQARSVERSMTSRVASADPRTFSRTASAVGAPPTTGYSLDPIVTVFADGQHVGHDLCDPTPGERSPSSG